MAMPSWVKYSSRHRESIIYRVLIGEITPEEAEVEAAALHLGPLQESPDPLHFNPKEEVWWSLPMVAAWIMYRDFDRVRRAWPLFSELVSNWEGPKICQTPPPNPADRIYRYKSPTSDRVRPVGAPKVPGYELAKLPDIPLIIVISQHWEDKNTLGPVALQPHETLTSLWKSLLSGELIAEGIPFSGDVRVPIREAEWIDLNSKHSFKWPVDAIGDENYVNPRYTSVRVRSAKVLSLWPDADSKDLKTKKTALFQRDDFHVAIRQTFEALWPNGFPIGKMVQQRDSEIIQEMKKSGLKSPSSRTISRALKGK